MLSIYRAPHSYTGEESVEFSLHGSPIIAAALMDALTDLGSRPAGAGEFTERAFLNGKLDLAQAEAVADLISADSRAAQQSALFALRGGYSRRLAALRDKLLTFAALVELELDFGEEDVAFTDLDALMALLDELRTELSSLAESFKAGNAIRQGIRVAIIGRPNAGKSTLLNALLGEERALVSPTAGTTRDTIEETLHLGGLAFRFIDTAGLHDATDEIEQMGIARTREKIQSADFVLYLYDAHQTTAEQLQTALAELPPDGTRLILSTKADLGRHPLDSGHLAISAQSGLGLDGLRAELSRFASRVPSPDAGLVTNARHYSLLRETLGHVEGARAGLMGGLSGDLLAVDIRAALRSLGEITGQVTTDEVLGYIFGKFCIGK